MKNREVVKLFNMVRKAMNLAGTVLLIGRFQTWNAPSPHGVLIHILLWCHRVVWPNLGGCFRFDRFTLVWRGSCNENSS